MPEYKHVHKHVYGMDMCAAMCTDMYTGIYTCRAIRAAAAWYEADDCYDAHRLALKKASTNRGPFEA